MDDISGLMIRDSIQDKSNSEALEKLLRPAGNERKSRSYVRELPRLHAGSGQEHPGTSGRICYRQPPAASAIDHGGTPRHQGQFLVGTWGLTSSRPARLICATFLCCGILAVNPVSAQQFFGSEDKPVSAKAPDGKPEPPGKVEVQPVAKDDEIMQRIADILKTTSWFSEPKVTVQEGVRRQLSCPVGVNYLDRLINT
ncbi:hypothetical protein GO003_007460 [Methylicorpusculum oleiharenae]|uniref:hypothetical protein n=1 Tax=Methylicorpusculum oleiharenae TaxID=1338687 RepID=UPI001E652450|nr:hypothetical protein [Methylicorpusculum oleiharenae]MCD2450219.1 hypothetical protein [Methylicorpusculum oleiharenae]